MRDSTSRYGSITRIFHWVVAFLIGWQMMKFFDRVSDGEHWIGQTLVPWHVSIGTLAALLIAAWIFWAAKQSVRPAQNASTVLLVRAGHGLLFAGMVLMPVTGISAMVGGGYGWSAFGMQIVPQGQESPWMTTFGSLHSPLAWTLLLLIAGHIGITLVHHFICKDDTLRRMT